jgi:hypothetical protein
MAVPDARTTWDRNLMRRKRNETTRGSSATYPRLFFPPHPHLPSLLQAEVYTYTRPRWASQTLSTIALFHSFLPLDRQPVSSFTHYKSIRRISPAIGTKETDTPHSSLFDTHERKNPKKKNRHTATGMCMVEHQLTDSCSRVQYDLVPLLRLVKIWFWSHAYQSTDFRAHMSDAGNANRRWCKRHLFKNLESQIPTSHGMSAPQIYDNNRSGNVVWERERRNFSVKS